MKNGEADQHAAISAVSSQGRRRVLKSNGATRFDGNERSLKDFFIYFHPLLMQQARIFGVEEELRDEIVTTFLDDKVEELASTDLPPASLTGYVVRGFRNRLRNLVRDFKTRQRVYQEAAIEEFNSDLRVAEPHSKYREFPSQDEDNDAETTALAIRELARFAKSKLSEEDTELLIEVSNRVPLRDVAAWHNISYPACRTRVHRLRERIRELTRAYIATMQPRDRVVVERFLRRAGATEV